ncbi:Tyrosine recombinase XerD [subsurface metagenome]
MRQTKDFTLLSRGGQRKYLDPGERDLFASFAKQEDRETRTFCLMLRETGVRISEGLNLTVDSIDLSSKCVNVETLKKRTRGVYRQIPLSENFLDELNLVHQIKEKQKTKKGRKKKLWSFSRRTGGRRIERIMDRAGIKGEQACPKGLRHAFGVACVLKGIPLPTVQKWMGHASMNTTAIYLQVTGKEERDLAGKLWE